jgi:hypothetical protein
MGIDVVEKLGHTYLVVSEIQGRADVKIKAVERSRIDTKLRGNERITGETTGFKCKNTNGENVYAVISKKKAKRTESFSPDRAWTANEKTFKLLPVKSVAEIKCSWDPEAEEEYPF